jgi:hypothetical protein
MELKITVLLLLIALNACNQQVKQVPEQNNPVRQSIPVISEIEGKNFAEAQKLLGTPSQDEQFVLGEGMNSEFRVGLKNYFDFSDSIARQNQIREVTWPYGVEMGQPKLLTVWYVKKDSQWTYVDIFEWHQGDLF